MKIEIIGVNTSKGLIMKNRIIDISASIKGKIIINLVNDNLNNNLPLLYINDKLISKGRIMSKRELVKYLKNNYKE